MSKILPKVLTAFLSAILLGLLSFSYVNAIYNVNMIPQDDNCIEYFACYAGCSEITDPDESQSCKNDCNIKYPECVERVDCDTLLAGCFYNCNGDPACMEACTLVYDDCALMCQAWAVCNNWCDINDPNPASCKITKCDAYWPECNRYECEDQLTACYDTCDGSAVCYRNCDEMFYCSEPCEGWQLCIDWCYGNEQDPTNCLENCTEEYPDCKEEEPTCEDYLQDCYDTCPNPECFTDVCDAQFDCEEPCQAWNECRDYCATFFTDPIQIAACQTTCDENSPECPPEEEGEPEEEECTEEDMQSLQLCLNSCQLLPTEQEITACEDSCYFDWPDCPRNEEYKDCYDLCFENYTIPDDIVQCILACQDQYPGEYEPPFEIVEPRCFEEIPFFDYVDVPYTNWAWPPINFLTRIQVKKGAGIGPNSATFESRIVRGYNRNDEDDSFMKPGEMVDEFLPFRELNRFEASKIATLISCFTIPDMQANISKPTIFSDLDPFDNEYMNRVVYRACEVGLFEGYMDNTFKPMQAITRAEFLKVLLTVGGFDVYAVTYPNSGFSDVTDPSLWYYQYIAFASHQPYPIVKGFPDGTFKPNEPIKRDQAMNIVTNTFLNLGWIERGGN